MFYKFLMTFCKVLTIVLYIVVIGFTLVDKVPHNILSDYVPDLYRNVSYYIPQGWAFFTRDSKESQIYLYQKVDGVWTNVDLRYTQAKYFWGIKKDPSYIHGQLGIIYRDYLKKEWFVDTKIRLPQKNIYDIQMSKTVWEIDKLSSHGLQSGEYAMIIQEIVPYSWFHKFKNLEGPAVICGFKLVQ